MFVQTEWKLCGNPSWLCEVQQLYIQLVHIKK